MTFSTIGAWSTRHPSAGFNAFGKQLGEFKNWRDELAAAITEYQTCVETHGLAHGDDDLRVYELIDTLKSDRLTIALVAEFSRGKTELINAIFFADYKQRLLPSDAGRTTMCPTELLYNEHEPPCLKLLPMSTRQSSLTIAEYKRLGSHWHSMPLDITAPKAMAQTLQEIVKTRMVDVAQAEELGLYDRSASNAMTPVDGKVEIPEWRHAIINFPHPLLRQGLVVLDTPGLNSLGTEPELTLSMLPSAHAVLFVLAADTGVTKSDMEMWRNHIGQRGESRRHFVALNKVDTLWDELRDSDAIAASIEHQVDDTARLLGVSRDAIFPVSAQKGLLGKVKGDEALLNRSGLRALEQKLATDVISVKQAIIRDKVAHEIGALVEKTRAMIEARLTSTRAQLTELKELTGKSRDAIHQMIDRIEQQQQAYERTLADFQSTRAVLSRQIKVLLDYLDMEAFDLNTARLHTAMKESWTTQGLRNGMKTLFDNAVDTMEKAGQQALAVLQEVVAAHEKFHRQHGLARLRPADFSLAIYRGRLQRLYDEAEAFRKSPVTLITEQHVLIKKFFVNFTSRARQIYVECNTAAHQWSKAIMAPVLAQAREHKFIMDSRLENLRSVHEDHGRLSSRITEIETNQQTLLNQLRTIEGLSKKIGTASATNAATIHRAAPAS